jgi:hypothetical protein
MHKRLCKILEHCYKSKFHFYNWRSTIEWYKENLGVLPKIMPIQKILGHLHAWRAKFIWCKTSYAGEWNVDEN